MFIGAQSIDWIEQERHVMTITDAGFARLARADRNARVAALAACILFTRNDLFVLSDHGVVGVDFDGPINEMTMAVKAYLYGNTVEAVECLNQVGKALEEGVLETPQQMPGDFFLQLEAAQCLMRNEERFLPFLNALRDMGLALHRNAEATEAAKAVETAETTEIAEAAEEIRSAKAAEAAEAAERFRQVFPRLMIDQF